MPFTPKIPRKYLTILAHLSLWCVFLGAPIYFKPPGMEMQKELGLLPLPETHFWIAGCLNLSLIVFFYLNYGFLLPKFYLKGKVFRYYLSILVSFLLFQAFVAMVRNIGLAHIQSNQVAVASALRITHAVSVVFFVLMWGASFGFRIGEEWWQAKRARLEAELNLLKSQINPHFLLNSLNNLYAVAITTPERTPATLLQLSEIVAYILYECDRPRVSLARDLLFIQNYIALQQQRLPPNVTLTTKLPDNDDQGAEIEPMILIPFIENAFKHGLTTQQPCEIFISISVLDKKLEMLVKNQIFPKKTSFNGNISGIGIANTRQRLEHSYLKTHKLNIQNDGKIYCVSLSLQL